MVERYIIVDVKGVILSSL